MEQHQKQKITESHKVHNQTPNTSACVQLKQRYNLIQGVVVEGGGERKGMEGKVVGIVGIEGMFGSEVAGSGGRVTFGTVGMVGRGDRDGIVGKGGTLA